MSNAAVPPGVRVKQTSSELQVCAAAVQACSPSVFLELGSWEGATLCVYARCCLGPSPLVIAVDGGRLGSGKKLAQTVAALRDRGIDAHWIKGDSHQPAMLDRVRELLAGRAVDFLHVDGDHSKAGVLADWRMYSPLLRPGGLAAFHDIAARTCHVREAWPEIRAEGATWCELIGPEYRGRHESLGIGMVWTKEAP